MTEIEDAVREAELAQEQTDLEKLDKAIKGLETLSRAFKSFATKEELTEAEGRRCILAISGLKTTKRAYYFEITGASIRLCEPYRDYTTLIIAPLDSVLRVFKGVAAGDKWAFSNERARGKAIFKGSHSLFDAYALGEAFKRFSELARRYSPGGIDLGI
jgi:hypothetical protein